MGKMHYYDFEAYIWEDRIKKYNRRIENMKNKSSLSKGINSLKTQQ